MALRILQGDCRDRLRELPAESVHCVVTSPPYFGLRDYGTAKWDGGDPGCDHLQGKLVSPRSTLRSDGREHVGPYDAEKNVPTGMPYGKVCGKCGARRIDSQIGLEETPDAYVDEIVAVFREVRRVLRADGTVWLNLGDSYFSTTKGTGGSDPISSPKQSWKGSANGQAFKPIRLSAGYLPIKPKDLIGIPWRVAFALQADGWWLRSEIIWAKPNPMPESVTDRPTKAHEQIFLLAKSAIYYYDAAAIAEPDAGKSSGNGFTGRQGTADYRPQYGSSGSDGKRRTGGDGTSEPWLPGCGRNKRTVWTVATQPFAEAHFATFPPALIEPCILGGCPKGGTVLDPFGGAGTTGLVADRLGRNAVLIELNPAYADMARRRITGDAPLFSEVGAA